MFAKANWRLAFRLETKSVCNKPQQLPECQASLCRRLCSTVLASNLASCLRALLGAACHFLLSPLWVFQALRVLVPANILAFLPSKAVAVALSPNRCHPVFMVFLVNF